MVIVAPTTQQPTIRTTRLELRPFLPDHASRVMELAGAREIAETTLNIPHPYPEGAAEAWIATHQQAWEAGSGVTFGIVQQSANAVIGAIGLTIKPEHASGELGYWVGVPYWNSGYCTEAAGAILDFAFDTLGLHRVQARHLTRNPASGRVMQKLGMRLEGIHRESVRKWDRFEDLALYAILADERSITSTANRRDGRRQ
jgi:RimJ/RimL family protein N-acetyltransferase